MSAASFACCYPLLKRILKSAEIDDSQRLEILKIFEVYAEIRSDSDTVRIELAFVNYFAGINFVFNLLPAVFKVGLSYQIMMY